MFRWLRKNGPRREQIRKDRPDTAGKRIERLKSSGVLVSIQIAIVFFLAACAILLLREEVVPYRPGQYVHHDIVSRIDFEYMDQQRLADAQRKARQDEANVYSEQPDAWKALEEKLLAIPDRVAAANTVDELNAELRKVLDSGSFTLLKEYRSEINRTNYNKRVKGYIAALRRFDPAKPENTLVILSDETQKQESENSSDITVQATDSNGVTSAVRIKSELAYSPKLRGDLETKLSRFAGENAFELTLQPKIVALTLNNLKPTYHFDQSATAAAQNRAANQVTATQGRIPFRRNEPIVRAGEITQEHWQRLRAENDAYVRSLDRNRFKRFGGLAGIVLILTIVLSAYVAKHQPRVVRKPPRAISIAALLLSMLLVAQLTAVGTSPLLVFAVAPTILVAMIMTIAYDQRFAMGIATLHAVLVAVALGQGLTFFVIVFAGVMACCYLLDDIRTRSKLIEVGGASAIAMMVAAAAAGLVHLDPPAYIARACLYTGAAGLAVGFVVLGILPFIEKAFRITTSMTLLEMADASHPLLRRLQLEAPGTYNHSLQVATIAESCADSIGVNSLLCRVASYYHDVGKINKPDYFCENQTDGVNRHMNLSPSVSLLIIIGHVKDGIELAKEYNLPTSLFPFIQQHHGTTLVEFFYHQAVTKQDKAEPDGPAVSEVQYRYPGPRPRTKEIAIVMIADAVESATRSMVEPSAGRIEVLVEEIISKRMADGQFDDCDLSLRDIQAIQRSCVKSLMSIYHGRIAYPSSANIQQGPAPAVTPAHPAVRSA